MGMLERWRAFFRKFFNPHVVRGRRGERWAVRHLKKQGFRILERNWHHGRYEIDIIARDRSCIVFVEVRGRQSNSLQSGYDSVNRQKRCAIMQAIQAYLRQHPGSFTYRFDIISIQWDAQGNFMDLHHYENVKLGIARH